MMRRLFLLISVVFALLRAAEADAQEVYAEMTTARTNVYLNETVVLTLTVRSTGAFLGDNLTIAGLPPDDVLKRVSEIEQKPLKRETTARGRILETRRSTMKFRPMRTGEIAIAPRLHLTIVTKQRSVWGTTMLHSPRTIAIRPIHLGVRQLPPAGGTTAENFGNAVGNFKFDVSIVPSDVAVGDLINIFSTIKGDGYLKEVSPIGVPPDTRGFKVYDAQPATRETGETGFKQIVIPLSTNAVEIPELSFTYFDPDRSEYVTLSRGPFPITFHPERTITIEQFNPTDSHQHPQKGHGEKSPPPPTHKEEEQAPAENVKVLESTPARIAPAHSALATFELPKQADAEIIEVLNGWSKVDYNNNRGWVPDSALVPANGR